MSTQKLEEVWSEFCSEFQISAENNAKWLEYIRSAYQPRICYDLPYLELKLEHFENSRPFLKAPYEIFIALIFQSIYYDTKSTDSAEKCIEKLREFATEVGLDKNPEMVKRVEELIDLSVTNSTDEHKTEGMFGTEDHHFFLDINLVIWGSDFEHYSEFSVKTRTEYEFLNDTAYKNLRLKVLQSLLLIPNLFATKEFRSLYEEQARSNIKKEIDELK